MTRTSLDPYREELEELGYTLSKDGKTVYSPNSGGAVAGLTEHGGTWSGSKRVAEIIRSEPRTARPETSRDRDIEQVVSLSLGGTKPKSSTYKVKKGDNLWNIAKENLGKGSRWQEIYQANKDIIDDPDLIRPGQTLKLPTSSSSLSPTQSVKPKDRSEVASERDYAPIPREGELPKETYEKLTYEERKALGLDPLGPGRPAPSNPELPEDPASGRYDHEGTVSVPVGTTKPSPRVPQEPPSETGLLSRTRDPNEYTPSDRAEDALRVIREDLLKLPPSKESSEEEYTTRDRIEDALTVLREALTGNLK